MVKPPAPTYATVFYGVFAFFLLKIFGNNLLLYRLFIDDELVLWKRYNEECDASDLRALKKKIQEWYGMEWTFQVPFLNLDLMDPTIDIKENKITKNLFDKKINIYLYIPPHSTHPPGVINGIIYGQIHRITNLCY